MSAALRVADVFRQHWTEYDCAHQIAPHQRQAARHLLACRTAALGGHLHCCARCGATVPLYNPCRDRHCPTCQTLAKEEWLADRRAELLPGEYFHTVFTLPHDLNPLIDANRKLLLGELFATVNGVLQRFAADPQWRLQGQLGFLAALHTWTQKLQEHFHLHCVIPGGVWQREKQRWQPCRRRFLFGKQALCDAFRNRRKELCLPAAEFIRRFLYHILPPGFQKIRYYGWLAAGNKQATLAAIRRTLAVAPPPPRPAEEPAARILRLTGIDVRRCPVCGQAALVYAGPIAPAFATGPPCA